MVCAGYLASPDDYKHERDKERLRHV